MRVMTAIGIAYIIWNLAAFAVMGIDKERARNKQWRIRERTLLSIATFLGALGIWVGMVVFRHKIRHAAFRWGIPVLFLVNAWSLHCLFTWLMNT